ncbi:hypothetical protein BDA99DRAFT_185604 [Phascolomyces articulosus]|uniref:Uncharacterized protein n=1 Tax=Phascolomyces articulosus TaxID=60185 RepID=A0AAD5K5T0_9FUNG|nr:hypothetical protein BDA99DRAFT_185604 [Phascolomyces articulosus]
MLAPTFPSQSLSSSPPSHTATTEQIKKDRHLSRSKLYTANRKSAATFESVHEIRRQRFIRENAGKGQSDTDRRNKEARTRKLRHKIYHQKLSSSWRRPGGKSNIQFFGTFKSFNSRIKKHRRGANSRLACELNAPENDKVIPTNEFRSSKTCPTCHSPAKQQKYRRGNNLVSANGSLRSTNKSCPDFHRNTYNRDDVGAFNISVIGFSKALSSNNQPIPPFCRSMMQTYSVSPSLEKYMT